MPEKSTDIDILNLELLFQRYLSNPLRKWSTVVQPYIVDTSGAASDAEVAPNLQVGRPRVVVDIEDVSYDTIRTFSGSHTIAKNYSMYIRCLDYPTSSEEESRVDRQLKMITDDICKALQSDKQMEIYQEFYVERDGDNNSPNVVTFPDLVGLESNMNTFQDQIENYPDLEGLAGFLPFPYHVTVLQEIAQQDGRTIIVVPDETPDDLQYGRVNRIYGILGSYDSEDQIWLQFYGALAGTERQLDEPEQLYRLETQYVHEGSRRVLDTRDISHHKKVHQVYQASYGTLVNQNLPYDNEVVQVSDNLFIPFDAYKIDIKPSNLQFQLVNTFFTFIDSDDVGRELRNEILVRVKINTGATL